jgi:hypothetical protein
MMDADKAIRLRAALKRLVTLLRDTEREFPDECWRVANAFLVPYEVLADAYDEYCRDK